MYVLVVLYEVKALEGGSDKEILFQDQHQGRRKFILKVMHAWPLNSVNKVV